ALASEVCQCRTTSQLSIANSCWPYTGRLRLPVPPGGFENATRPCKSRRHTAAIHTHRRLAAFHKSAAKISPRLYAPRARSATSPAASTRTPGKPASRRRESRVPPDSHTPGSCIRRWAWVILGKCFECELDSFKDTRCWMLDARPIAVGRLNPYRPSV